MRRVTDEEIKNIALDILKYFRDICEENNLKYYLAYGTLIGAIRHKGFIPWDDDIDVVMPREDYYKLVDLFKSQNIDSKYKLVSVDTEEDFTAPLAKIIDTRTKLIQSYGFIEKVELGVYIDIFILDGAADNYEQALQHYENAYSIYLKWIRANTMMFVPRQNKLKSFVFWMRNIPLKIKGYNYWLNLLLEHNKQYSFYDCKYVSVLEAGTPGAKRNVMKASDFGDGINVLFEGEEFRAPINYDTLLRQEYGDYMELPPEDKQVSHHYAEACWK